MAQVNNVNKIPTHIKRQDEERERLISFLLKLCMNIRLFQRRVKHDDAEIFILSDLLRTYTIVKPVEIILMCGLSSSKVWFEAYNTHNYRAGKARLDPQNIRNR